MANCPNCGSSHIQLKKETDINWGRTIAGYALFGVVGGAVGAVTGEDRNVNACLDCGTSWKAKDLYKLLKLVEECTGAKLNLTREFDRYYVNWFLSKILANKNNGQGAEIKNYFYELLQVIEEYTGAKLNLSKKSDRLYMINFVEEIIPYIDKVREAEINANKHLENLRSQIKIKQSNSINFSGTIIGFLISIGGCVAVSTLIPSSNAQIVMFLPMLAGFIVDILYHILNKKSIEEKKKKEIENLQNNSIKDIKIAINNVEEDLNLKLKNFIDNNPFL